MSLFPLPYDQCLHFCPHSLPRKNTCPIGKQTEPRTLSMKCGESHLCASKPQHCSPDSQGWKEFHSNSVILKVDHQPHLELVRKANFQAQAGLRIRNSGSQAQKSDVQVISDAHKNLRTIALVYNPHL